MLFNSVMDYSAAIHIIDCFLIDGSKVAKQHSKKFWNHHNMSFENFKPGMCRLQSGMHLLFLVCMPVCVCVCVSVCPPPRPLVTSGMIWFDIDCVWLVKQVLQLFPLFICFIWHLLSIKWMGVALVTQEFWTLANKAKVKWYYIQKEHPMVATRQNTSVIKMSGQMCSDAFKRRLALASQ